MQNDCWNYLSKHKIKGLCSQTDNRTGRRVERVGSEQEIISLISNKIRSFLTNKFLQIQGGNAYVVKVSSGSSDTSTAYLIYHEKRTTQCVSFGANRLQLGSHDHYDPVHGLSLFSGIQRPRDSQHIVNTVWDLQGLKSRPLEHERDRAWGVRGINGRNIIYCIVRA